MSSRNVRSLCAASLLLLSTSAPAESPFVSFPSQIRNDYPGGDFIAIRCKEPGSQVCQVVARVGGKRTSTSVDLSAHGLRFGLSGVRLYPALDTFSFVTDVGCPQEVRQTFESAEALVCEVSVYVEAGSVQEISGLRVQAVTELLESGDHLFLEQESPAQEEGGIR